MSLIELVCHVSCPSIHSLSMFAMLAVVFMVLISSRAWDMAFFSQFFLNFYPQIWFSFIYKHFKHNCQVK